ncbi:Arylsulfatase [Limihaloglobus sulfuriphilus]|uniref:Arylsulfatase n=1 Tax=Limihaloglobus sulfuriphilus TaxID=1851148 RepID=A0A1Q2MCS0_9BACT|nr:sulfatase [Limihaloglobus sulfuriphilus]AQQ70338.1 Arylsulfatase [Limihaloglobus sulfuriphilus]
MLQNINRREFLKTTSMASGAVLMAVCGSWALSNRRQKPNLVFVFADQWRAQDTGYAGNSDVLTPNLDKLEKESVNFKNAVSCCPVCSPFRASLMTGQYPLTHGLLINDLQLSTRAVSFAHALAGAGYDTAYIGKWHLDGSGRSDYIPPERRQGFDYWKVLECTHNYNHSEYYAGSSDKVRAWDGYDAYAQTDDAEKYITSRSGSGKPFALFLSWGPPHNPYRTGPKMWLDYYSSRDIKMRPNVSPQDYGKAKKDITGYYAHCSALDRCVGQLLSAIRGNGIADNTIFVFTADHGDMLYSHRQVRKQKPWEESVRIPFLVKCPDSWQVRPRQSGEMINSPDIMPTMLSLCGVDIPDTAQGTDYSGVIFGGKSNIENSALIMCPSPFGEWHPARGGVAYRGVRTKRYTYVRKLDGPWLLYDNLDDPYQMNNLCGKTEYLDIQQKLEKELEYWLKKTGDDFASGPELLKRCGYRVDKKLTVPFDNPDYHGQVSKPAAI